MAIDTLTVESCTREVAAARAAVEPSSCQGSASVEDPREVDQTVVDQRVLDQRVLDQTGQGRAVADAATSCLSTPAVPEKVDASVKAFVSDLLQLTKPRIVVMILVTTVATALIGAGGLVGSLQLLWLLLGTGLIAGSAGAANQVWERVIDRRMTRTARRPLPAGRMSLTLAIAYTAMLGISGTAILWSKFSFTPAAVGLMTWALYVLVYTPMKTRTSWNTTVGAIAGAIPMLIGYTAMGGSIADVTGWLLVGILVAWQYPHFMAIAWMYRRQYGEAGFIMSTTVDPSGRSAALQSLAGSMGLIVCALALCWIPDGWIGAALASSAVLASGWPMLRASIQFAGKPADNAARRLLHKSLLVLPAVLLIVTLRLFW